MSSIQPRRFFIETWGCQMNELDSQRMAGQLMQQGILPTHDPQQADLILLNSCSVREKAEQKVYSRLGAYRQLKRQRPDLLIGFCGCVAQQQGEKALEREPDLDFVVGTARVGELRQILAQRLRGQRIVATGFPQQRQFDIDAVCRDGQHKGMVTIIEGCDKRCTFCVVPMTRGPERSRSLAEILTEVQHLLDYGFVEIELLGQTVNHWRDPQDPSMDFADLLDAVVALPGLQRLRFVTSYPKDFTSRMVQQVARHEIICPYIHLPVQSGSDWILRRMGRGYTRAEYLDLVADLRRARPDLALSTDIIVGFPGESEQDFHRTLELVEQVRFASAYAFKYSPRPGTAALRLSHEAVEGSVADRRLQQVLALQDRIQSEINQTLEGRTFQVLVTGWGRQPGFQIGRTPCHRVVHFSLQEDAIQPGRLTSVKIRRANPHSLIAEQL